MKLTDDDPDTLDAYLQCVYHNTAANVDAVDDIRSLSLVRVYVLADKLGDVETANMTIDAIIWNSDMLTLIPCPCTVAYAFANSPESSPLRRMLVDYYVHEASLAAVSDGLSRMSHGFLCTLVLESRTVKERSSIDGLVGEVFCRNISNMPRCHYHQHDELYPHCK